MTDEHTTPEHTQPSPATPDAPLVRSSAYRLSGDLGSILAIGGAILLLVAFFLPWWSADVELIGNPEEAVEELASELNHDPEAVLQIADAMVGNIDWYIENITIQMVVEPAYDEVRDFVEDNMKRSARETDEWGIVNSGQDRPELKEFAPTVSLPGWKTSVGFGGLLLAVVTLLVMLPATGSTAIRQWRWIIDLLLLTVTVILAVYMVVFFITCPGENVEIGGAFEFRQGVSLGIFAAIAGDCCLIFGLAKSGLAGARKLQATLPAISPTGGPADQDPPTA